MLVDWYSNSTYKGLVGGGEAKSASGMDSNNVDWGFQVFEFSTAKYNEYSDECVVNSATLKLDIKSNQTTTTARMWTTLHSVVLNGTTNPVTVLSSEAISAEFGDQTTKSTSYATKTMTVNVGKKLGDVFKPSQNRYMALHIFADRASGVLKPTLYIRNVDITFSLSYKSWVRFYNYDGTIASEKVYAQGVMPSIPTNLKSPGDGYVFDHWASTPGGAEITVSKAKGNDTAYYAVWRLSTLTATWKYQTASGEATTTSQVNPGSTPTPPANIPTSYTVDDVTVRKIYTLTGWMPAPGAMNSNTTYTAQYTLSYENKTVSFTDAYFERVSVGNRIDETNKAEGGEYIIARATLKYT